MDSFALAVSVALQHGVPLRLFLRKVRAHPLRAQRMVQQSRHRFAKSIVDYIFRWLQVRFLTGQQQFLFDNLRPKNMARTGI